VNCKMVRSDLPQYIADGEPPLATYAGLRGHLADCAACQSYAERLRAVEDALHAYPPVASPACLAHSVVDAIVQEQQARPEEWELLPWDVWVPAAAFALAILIAMMSIPSQLLTIPGVEAISETIQQWPTTISGWVNSVRLMTKEHVFWAIWSGVFATTAGLGISLSLVYFHKLSRQKLNDLETRVADTANRLLDYARRTH
jgi:hypothetical protein